MTYEFQQFYIRDDMMKSIDLYIDHGCEPGSFLTAIICNDLKHSVMCADHENLNNIPAYVSYFYNEVPGPAWGSIENMKSWMESKREKSEL